MFPLRMTVCAMSPLPSSARLVTEQVSVLKCELEIFIILLLLQELASSLMTMSSSDDDDGEFIYLITSGGIEFFMNRAI